MMETMIDRANTLAAGELAKHYYQQNRELKREIAQLRARIIVNEADVEITRGRGFRLIGEEEKV